MNTLTFLGTGGARIVVSRQIRHSGGVWFSLEGTNFLLDPGPGSLIRCLEHNLSPTNLQGIILSHRHLDHSSDINILIEAMTEGGFKRRGTVFAPEDALGEDAVILSYIRNYPRQIQFLKEAGEYRIGNLRFTTPVRHLHGTVQTYGFNFHCSKGTISWITDTRYFPSLTKYYSGDIIVFSLVTLHKSTVDHLCREDIEKFLSQKQPKVAILTHFGMTILKANPEKIARTIQDKTGVKTIATEDGMTLKLEELI